MNWLQASWHFLKAVTAAYDPIAREIDYQHNLQLLEKSQNISIWDIIDIIIDYKHHDFFKIEDTYPLFKRVNHVESNYVQEFKDYPIILEILLTKLLQNFKDTVGFNMDYSRNILNEYLALEKLPISPQALHPFQLQIIDKIMKLLLRLEEEGDAAWFGDAIGDLSRFYGSTTKFPHSLLEGLFKRFGMDNYLVLLHNKSNSSLEQIKHKSILNKWDVALLLRHQQQFFFPSQDLKTMIQKSDPEAMEYLRGFIFYWGKLPSEVEYEEFRKHLFVLAEDGAPMNENLKTVAWPQQIAFLHFDELSEEIQQKWGPIFSDFGILAH